MKGVGKTDRVFPRTESSESSNVENGGVLKERSDPSGPSGKVEWRISNFESRMQEQAPITRGFDFFAGSV